METTSTILDENNYVNWSALVKSNLVTQDLWSVVESTIEPPIQEEYEVAFTNWSKKNFKALQMIWNSCGNKAFSRICAIDSAHIAWNTLLKIYGTPVDQGGDDTIALSEDNYRDWSTRVKCNLEAQDLWSIIESSSDPPRQEDDEVVFTNWRDKNFMALRVIRNFCGWKAFSKIKGKDSAKNAWITLARVYDLPQNFEPVRDLLKIVHDGEWDAIEEFLKHHPGLKNARITLRGETALHIAVYGGHVHIVEKLVDVMSKESLEIQTVYGFTALDEASCCGNYRMTKYMLSKNDNLTSIEASGQIPLTWALIGGHKELSRYLYSFTEKEILMRNDAVHGATVCRHAIYARMWDIVLDLIQHHRPLAFALDSKMNSPVYALASSSPAFLSRNELSFWKRWMYSGIRIKSVDATNETRVNIPSDQVEENGSVRALFQELRSDLLSLLGLERLYEMKLGHLNYRKILHHICEEMPNLNTEQRVRAKVFLAIFRAIKEGNFEFVYKIVRRNPNLVWAMDEDRGTIFIAAVRYRQAKIFSLIYRLSVKNLMIASTDNKLNLLLHVAGMLAPSSQLNRLSGAALQMQRELQWFREVESISSLSHKQFQNKEGKTANEVFTESHENLRKEGEKWMKDTSTSCTVVSALITTIMFAAAFTVPGNNNQDTGLPIFLHEKLFMLFIISDSLSLFSSSTSLLMFMGILTSRYAEEDFLKSLPRKMIIGLSTLFFSIVTMMITFCATILLMLREKSWTPIPLICLASIPVSLFGVNQFSLLIDMFNSTYGLSIFDRRMKRWV